MNIMKLRILSLLLCAALLTGMTPAPGFAESRETAIGAVNGELVVTVDPEYGAFIEDDSNWDDSVYGVETASDARVAVSNWALENSIWLDALESTGYPVQTLHDRGLLFNANKTGWYKNYIYRYWKGLGLNENDWKL